MEEDFDLVMKVIVVGNGKIGKTTMITRFVKGIFTGEYKKTLGVDFLEKRAYVKSVGQDIQFHVWDTAGQEEYDELTKEYYKGASACIIAFSTTDRDSFEAVETWKQKVEAQCGPTLQMLIVQTKIDLLDEIAMGEEEIRSLAKRTGLRIFPICSKDNTNIKEVFEQLAYDYVNYGKFATNPNTGPVAGIGDLKKPSGPRTIGEKPKKEAQPPPQPQKAPQNSIAKKSQDYEPPSGEETFKDVPVKNKKKKDGCIIF